MADEPPPIVPPPAPEVPDTVLETVASCCTVTVVRYELYPADEPTCHVVGFAVKCNDNGKIFHSGTQLPLAETLGLEDLAILHKGWHKLFPDIQAWFTTACGSAIVVGSTYTPL